MIRLLADVLPFDPDEERRILEKVHHVVADTIDTIQGVIPQADGVSGSGGGHHSLPFILGGILAALIGLGFLIFIVRQYRHRGEQQLGFSRA